MVLFDKFLGKITGSDRFELEVRPMVRNAFRQGRTYAARLLRVSKRPIENESDGEFCLLRLEFEIFFILDTPPAVSSSGKIACRDLVVGPAVDVSQDASLTAIPGEGHFWG